MKLRQTHFEVAKAPKGKSKKVLAGNDQPKKIIITALKKFISARDMKIKRQLEDCNHLAEFERASQLAVRLTDPQQVASYICELNQEAIAHAHKHQEKLRECKRFWYGPAGLRWLAFKKNMEPEEWSLYESFMDDAAWQAFQELSLKNLAQEQPHKRSVETEQCLAVVHANTNAGADITVGEIEGGTHV